MPTDTFTASDGTTLGSYTGPGGVTYAYHADYSGGTFVINSNKLEDNGFINPFAVAGASWTIDNPDDFSVELDITAGPDAETGGGEPGIVLIAGLGAGQSFYAIHWRDGVACWQIDKVATFKASSATGLTFPNGVTKTLKATYAKSGANGVITAFVNGVQVATWTDTAALTITKVGIRSGFGDGQKKMDNLVLTSAAPPTPTPELNVKKPGAVDLADGATDAIAGNQVQGASLTRSYTLENTGTGTLTISGITFGAGVTETTSLGGGTTIAAGGSKTLTVSLDTSVLGAFSSTIAIASDDADEAIYNWTVTATITTVGVLSGYWASEVDWQWNIDSDTIGGAGSTEVQRNTCRSKHTWSVSGSGVRLAYANTRMSGVNGEEPAGPALTIKAAIEVWNPAAGTYANFANGTIRGTITAMAFNGLSSVTLASGELQQSDEVALTVAVGDVFFDLVYVVSAGVRFPVNQIPFTGSNQGGSNTGNDDRLSAAATYATIGDPGNPYLFHHVAARVTTLTSARSVVVGVFGDSIGGYVRDSLDALGFRNVYMGIAGESANGVDGGVNGGFGSPVRVLLATKCDFVIEQQSVNDFQATRTGAQVIATMESIAAKVAPVPMYCMTTTPICDSSDSFATTANQSERVTLPGSWAYRQAYNAALRGGTVAGVAGYFETADLVASTPGGDTWSVTPVSHTADGVHLSGTGAAAVTPESLAGAADVFVIVEPITTGLLASFGFAGFGL